MRPVRSGPLTAALAAGTFAMAVLVLVARQHGDVPPLGRGKRRGPADAATARLYCMVLSRAGADNDERRLAVLRTWGAKCDRLTFVVGGDTLSDVQFVDADGNRTGESAGADAHLLTVPIREEYNNTWAKVRVGVQHAAKFAGRYAWFVRADDDTYLVVENLRAFLDGRDADSREFYGANYAQFGGYVGTGAGLAFSFQTLLALLPLFDSADPRLCSTEKTHADDVHIARCLRAAGAAMVDTRDEWGRQRFFPGPFYWLMSKELIARTRGEWIYAWMKYPFGEGPSKCCARDMIGLHYLSPIDMYQFHTLLYTVSVDQRYRRR